MSVVLAESVARRLLSWQGLQAKTIVSKRAMRACGENTDNFADQCRPCFLYALDNEGVSVHWGYSLLLRLT